MNTRSITWLEMYFRKMLLILLMSLTLLTPFSPFGLFLNSAVIGLVLTPILKEVSPRRWGFVVFLVALAYGSFLWRYWPQPSSVYSVMIFIASGLLSHLFKIRERLLVIFCFLMIALTVATTMFLEGQPILREVSKEPGSTYTTDMRGTLKTYYLQKSGVPFYLAFAEGTKGATYGKLPPDIWGWRQPVVFFLWSILPGDGRSIYFLAAIWFYLQTVCAYLISRRFGLSRNHSLIAPLLLLPYFHFPLTSLAFLLSEWWGAGFAIFGLTALVYRRYWLAGWLLTLAVSSRELFLISFVAFIGMIIISRKIRNAIKLIIPLLLYFCFYFFIHLPNVGHYANELARGFAPHGLSALNASLAYGSWSYLLGPFRPILILLAATIIASLWRGVRLRFLVAAFLPLFTVILLADYIGALGSWQDYWGIYYVPMLLAVAPTIFLFLDKQREQEV